jgi:hypothetical protein
MRAAAVALVLIVGAAVVLWYGNTLNSWVLGGLIGGLAALLISVPISLLMFSYLARRQDERARDAEEDEDASVWGEAHHYPAQPAVAVYEAHAYALPAGAADEWDEPTVEYRPPARGRSLPAPSARPQASPSRLPVVQESQRYQQQPRPALPMRVRGQSMAEQRPHVRNAQPVRYPGFPGFRAEAPRSSYHTAALRASRQEAARQNAGAEAQSPRRLPALRSEQRFAAQPARQPRQARPLQPLQQTQAPQQYRPRRTVEGSAAHTAQNRSLPRSAGGGTGDAGNTDQLQPWQGQGRYGRARETQTDKIGGYAPQSGPLREQTTDQLGRHPQSEPRRRDPNVVSGSIKNPLVRRAPYMYEDDPMRQEMAQHIEEAPLVRRSSRYPGYAVEDD